jgi:hypothetical protein
MVVISVSIALLPDQVLINFRNRFIEPAKNLKNNAIEVACLYNNDRSKVCRFMEIRSWRIHASSLL